jgi:hypothetical protein
VGSELDRPGKKQANLGELRLLSTMPGVLMEVAFHDNPQDAAALKDPRFAQIVARAIYKGIVRYYAQRDGRSPIFLPEPPQAPVARQTGPGQVTLSWQPSPSDGGVLLGHPATAYKVYTSTDGFAWSDGVLVNGTTWTLSGLPEGRTVFFRVTGVNAGGESFPTPAVGVRVGPWGAPRLLIVDGFDRLDAAMRPVEDLGGSLGLVTRMPLARMNGFDALAGIGRALSLPFDGATDEAVASGALPLEGYAAVIWALGEEGFSEPTLDDAARARLRTYLSNGGRLILSGSNVGQDLSQRDPGFLRDVLRAGFSADDAGTRTVRPVSGGLLDGIGDLTLDDGTMGSHRVTTPDVLTPGPEAQILMQYPDGRAAATFFGAPCPQVAVFGFPLESAWPMSARAALLDRLLNAMLACGAPPETTITAPTPNALLNRIPIIAGTASPSDVTAVQVALQRTSDQQWWNGSGWGAGPVWLTATGRLTWSWSPPSDLADGTYGVLARAVRGTIVDPTPAAVTFTLDRTPPGTPGPDHPHGDDDLHPAGPDGVGAYGRRDAGRIRGADQHRPLHGNCAALPGQLDPRGLSMDGRRLRRGGQPLGDASTGAVLCRVRDPAAASTTPSGLCGTPGQRGLRDGSNRDLADPEPEGAHRPGPEPGLRGAVGGPPGGPAGDLPLLCHSLAAGEPGWKPGHLEPVASASDPGERRSLLHRLPERPERVDPAAGRLGEHRSVGAGEPGPHALCRPDPHPDHRRLQ